MFHKRPTLLVTGKSVPQKRENKDVYWADRTSPEAAGPLSAKNICDVIKKL